MSKLIGTVDLPGTKIEGTAAEVAVRIFEQMICPNTAMLFKQDPQLAAVFAYNIMGLAISQYADLVKTKHFKKQLDVITHNMVQNLKKERGELGS